MRVTSTSNQSAAADVQSTKNASKAAATDKNKKMLSKGAPESSGDTSGVNAEISPRAKEFAQAKKVAGDAPDVREAKIAELKKRISEGKYHVDADAVADKMVSEHLQTSLD